MTRQDHIISGLGRGSSHLAHRHMGLAQSMARLTSLLSLLGVVLGRWCFPLIVSQILLTDGGDIFYTLLGSEFETKYDTVALAIFLGSSRGSWTSIFQFLHWWIMIPRAGKQPVHCATAQGPGGMGPLKLSLSIYNI